MAVLFIIVLFFIVDLVVTFFAMLLGPLTGIPVLAGLTFWNWFAVVILAQVLTWTAARS